MGEAEFLGFGLRFLGVSVEGVFVFFVRVSSFLGGEDFDVVRYFFKLLRGR